MTTRALPLCLALFALSTLACSESHTLDDAGAPDAQATLDAHATPDAFGPAEDAGALTDAGLDPLEIGQVATSCGSPSQGLEPIDCTAYGDTRAYCVFGNHCACSDGFVCDGAALSGSECEAGVACIPAP